MTKPPVASCLFGGAPGFTRHGGDELRRVFKAMSREFVRVRIYVSVYLHVCGFSVKKRV